MSRAPAPGSVPVLYRDEDLLVVNKPAGLATTSATEGDCLTRRVQALDPAAPRLHPSSRLDAEVTGVVTFARTRKATLALLAARKAGAYGRCYVALGVGALPTHQGRVDAAIGLSPRDPRQRRVVSEGAPGARRAQTRYQWVGQAGQVTLVLLFPETGRTHQLRVHMAHVGLPLLGDRHYGGPQRIVLANGRAVRAPRTMLHCAWVQLPTSDGVGRRLAAPLPEDMLRIWAAVGGAPALDEIKELRAPGG